MLHDSRSVIKKACKTMLTEEIFCDMQSSAPWTIPVPVELLKLSHGIVAEPMQ
jgi:hypothetical protein